MNGVHEWRGAFISDYSALFVYCLFVYFSTGTGDKKHGNPCPVHQFALLIGGQLNEMGDGVL